MPLYPQTEKVTGAWPNPIETVVQCLGGGRTRTSLAPKLPHLSDSDILLLTGIMQMPREARPWGIVTWLADRFNISRLGLYQLADRVASKLLPQAQEVGVTGATIVVTQSRLKRTVLQASLPGKIAIRPLRHVLFEALGETRSIGWINQLLTEAGKRAGEVLGTIDHTPLGKVIVARDETFFHQLPILLIIEPVSSVILFAQATIDRKADTWGSALLMGQEQGAEIIGLVEDMAQMYGKSMEEAELDVPVQKDIWHIEAEGKKLLNRLEKSALAATGKEVKLENKLLKRWDDALFDQYIVTVTNEETAYEQHALFADYLSHFVDSLELVDWRSGEIREVETNRWLLTEVLQGLTQIVHPKIAKWRKKVQRHADQLLTANGWINNFVEAFRPQLKSLYPSLAEQDVFFRMVARHWRLNQALIGGHRSFEQQADETQATVEAFVSDDPLKQTLVEQVMGLFDASGRTSSMIENINSLLKPFIKHHQAFSSPETLQLYLNLFVLWHNCRVYERGKRKGKSPFQHAGIELPESNWLTLLGYPAV